MGLKAKIYTIEMFIPPLVYVHLSNLLIVSSLARVICGKAKFCLRMVRWFFSGFSGFRPPSMNDRLDISELFLKGP